jgi:translation initiation factor 5
MATVNVRRDVQDSFYRYKMPRLTAKVKEQTI